MKAPEVQTLLDDVEAKVTEAQRRGSLDAWATDPEMQRIMAAVNEFGRQCLALFETIAEAVAEAAQAMVEFYVGLQRFSLAKYLADLGLPADWATWVSTHWPRAWLPPPQLQWLQTADG